MSPSRQPAKSEKRRHKRHEVYVPVMIDSGDRSNRIGITRDASAGGACLCSASSFKEGETLRITFALESGKPGKSIALTGRVLRTESRGLEGSPWRQRLAVAFDILVPELPDRLLDT